MTERLTIAPDAAGAPVLVCLLEDAFQASPARRLVSPERWGRFDSRIPRALDRLLPILEATGTRATFAAGEWALGREALALQRVVDAGHELAVAVSAPADVDWDAAFEAAQAAARRTCGQPLAGAVVEGVGTDPAPVAAAAQRAGFAYVIADQSVEAPAQSPLRWWHSTAPRFWGRFWLRRWPLALADLWLKRQESPLLVLRSWELDAGAPCLAGLRRGERAALRMGREVLGDRLRAVLAQQHFTCAADAAGLEWQAPAVVRGFEDTPVRPPTPGVAGAEPVTLVVPCFNEAETLGYLKHTLEQLEEALSDRCAFQYIFVDDASSDSTAERLAALFGAGERVQIIRHPENRGVAAAILTGIRHAATDVVCSIDADCTYDPSQLAQMLPLLEGDVAVVTASPYHRRGAVANVPGWRLGLSKGLSFLYRRVLRTQLATYTSCFRVYRRDAVVDLELDDGGFLGVAEMLGRLDLRGARIVECPAVLEVRLFGQSKMRIAKTIGGHLRLLSRMQLARWRHQPLSPRLTESVSS